ncbi:M1 family metallopeptidase [Cognaticolwellia mytili]|uniref:M1 family metallopeptidase n=1 Tax=Cognaticolwellia mytili TaxID=1888913 RepID=UPI000A1702A5|nr:M1 family metallopeptidase [Cognaticolwellia mytili]
MKQTLLSSIIIISSLLSTNSASAELFPKRAIDDHQQNIFRGTITPERAWWDLTHYNLDIAVDPQSKSIAGTNTMKYKVLSESKRLQIELQPPMQLTKVEQNGKMLAVEQLGYSYFIKLEAEQEIGQEYQLSMHFSGIPHEAIRAPWDGGITWAKDDNGIDFIASTCQGLGASIWWPNKDHAYDEPNNGALISVEVPEHLMDVSNGRLIKVDHNKQAKTKTYHWQVVNPINNYGININIGDYVHFGEKYAGESGQLDMDYYVLRDNLEKAKTQFKDAKRTIEAFEHWFGPYPFYQDSFKLVEAPYLGMEHQSSVTYGNGYQNGYLGKDRSQAGPGMLFDFIIVHESGHEWFANNITHNDVADLWIHESFTNYSESLFLEYHFDQEKAFEYIRGQRLNIQNKSPIIGKYGVHQEGSSDMYDKGGNMLHTIRQIIDNDETWREILRGLNEKFYHSITDSAQVESYISEQASKDFSKIFDQYLRDIRIPTLEYFVKNNEMQYRWGNAIDGFDMPIKITIAGKTQWLSPTSQWEKMSLEVKNSQVKVDANFYVNTLNLLGN